MNIVFEDYDKKFKSKVLKGIENANNILKNIYDEVFINHEGIAYSVESKLDTGRVFCKTNIDEFIEIPKDALLKLNTKNLSDCLKSGKTKILSFYLDDSNNLIFVTTTCNFTVGEMIYDKKLNLVQINDIVENEDYKCNLNEVLERFQNKEFVNIKKDKYDLIITHKLFPMVNKCSEFNFKAKDNDDGTFYGIFENTVEERNKKDEITFGMKVIYIYKFMDLN